MYLNKERYNTKLATIDAALAIKPLDISEGLKEVKIKRRFLKRTGSWSIFFGILAKDIRNRLVNEGRNEIVIATGRARSGKSYSMLKLAKAIDPDFTVDQIVFSAEEFMKLLNDKGKTLKDGSVILWDEAGVGLSSREWFSILNKCINLILQTWGYKHLCLILTVPHFSFIDAQTRKLVNVHIQIVRRLKTAKKTIAKIHYLTPMNKHNQDYIKKMIPRIRIKGWRYAFFFMEFHIPDKAMTKAYEIKKKEFTSKLEASTLKDIQQVNINIDKVENKLKTDTQLIEEYYPALEKEIGFTLYGEPKISAQNVAVIAGIPVNRANVFKRVILEKYKEDHKDELETKKKSFTTNKIVMD